MIRIALPLLLVSLVAWALLYGLRGKVKNETYSAIRQGCIALSIGVAILLLVGLAFLFGGKANG